MVFTPRSPYERTEMPFALAVSQRKSLGAYSIGFVSLRALPYLKIQSLA